MSVAARFAVCPFYHQSKLDTSCQLRRLKEVSSFFCCSLGPLIVSMVLDQEGGNDLCHFCDFWTLFCERLCYELSVEETRFRQTFVFRYYASVTPCTSLAILLICQVPIQPWKCEGHD